MFYLFNFWCNCCLWRTIVCNFFSTFCGLKTYSTGLPWLTVLAPADPLTQDFQLQVSTNDFNLAGNHPVNITVAFANAGYSSKIIQTL